MSKLMCGFEQGGGGGGNSKRKEEEHNDSNYLRFSMDISKVYEYFRTTEGKLKESLVMSGIQNQKLSSEVGM